MESGKKRVITYPPNSTVPKMDGAIARTDALTVGGCVVSAEGSHCCGVELIAAQILAVVAENFDEYRSTGRRVSAGWTSSQS